MQRFSRPLHQAVRLQAKSLRPSAFVASSTLRLSLSVHGNAFAPARFFSSSTAFEIPEGVTTEEQTDSINEGLKTILNNNVSSLAEAVPADKLISSLKLSTPQEAFYFFDSLLAKLASDPNADVVDSIIEYIGEETALSDHFAALVEASSRNMGNLLGAKIVSEIPVALMKSGKMSEETKDSLQEEVLHQIANVKGQDLVDLLQSYGCSKLLAASYQNGSAELQSKITAVAINNFDTLSCHASSLELLHDIFEAENENSEKVGKAFAENVFKLFRTEYGPILSKSMLDAGAKATVETVIRCIIDEDKVGEFAQMPQSSKFLQNIIFSESANISLDIKSELLIKMFESDEYFDYLSSPEIFEGGLGFIVDVIENVPSEPSGKEAFDIVAEKLISMDLARFTRLTQIPVGALIFTKLVGVVSGSRSYTFDSEPEQIERLMHMIVKSAEESDRLPAGLGRIGNSIKRRLGDEKTRVIEECGPLMKIMEQERISFEERFGKREQFRPNFRPSGKFDPMQIENAAINDDQSLLPEILEEIKGSENILGLLNEKSGPNALKKLLVHMSDEQRNDTVQVLADNFDEIVVKDSNFNSFGYARLYETFVKMTPFQDEVLFDVNPEIKQVFATKAIEHNRFLTENRSDERRFSTYYFLARHALHQSFLAETRTDELLAVCADNLDELTWLIAGPNTLIGSFLLGTLVVPPRELQDDEARERKFVTSLMKVVSHLIRVANDDSLIQNPDTCVNMEKNLLRLFNRIGFNTPREIVDPICEAFLEEAQLNDLSKDILNVLLKDASENKAREYREKLERFN